MKKTLIITLFITISSIVYSQNPRLTFSNKNLAAYKQATTMIMLKEDDTYSKILKKVIEDNWTFNKYEFTTEEKLKSTYEEKTPLPMLGIFEGYIDYVGSYETSLTTGIPFIGFVTLFKTKKYYNLKNREVVHAFTINDLKELTTEKEIESFFTVLIQDLNNYLIVLGNPENKVHSRKAYWSYINKKDLKDFQNKKILISENDVDKKFKQDVSSAKKYNYKIVSKERIDEAILNKEDVLIYFPDDWQHINWAKDGRLLATIIRSKVSVLFKDFRKR